jgi:S-adenosylmethionine-dependent methyltransferase
LEKITAAEANRRFYRQYAERYDEVECCAASGAERRWLADRIDRSLRAIPRDPVRVLDAGGGTGTASSILLDRGLEPVLVDVSPEMLAEWTRKSALRGRAARTINEPLERFFQTAQEPWDLIVFSSVLHHLEDAALVLGAAAGRLARGGVILTAHDPTRADRLTRSLRRVDWTAYAFVHDRRMLAASAMARLRSARSVQSVHVGRKAERHAVDGLDETRLAATLAAAGLEVLEVDRQAAARHALVRAALRLFRRSSNFSILAQRPVLTQSSAVHNDSLDEPSSAREDP